MNPSKKQKIYIFAGLLTAIALLVTLVAMNTGIKGAGSETTRRGSPSKHMDPRGSTAESKSKTSIPGLEYDESEPESESDNEGGEPEIHEDAPPAPIRIIDDALGPLPTESQLALTESEAEIFTAYKHVRQLIGDAKDSQDLAQWKPVLEAALAYLKDGDIKSRSAFTLKTIDKTDLNTESVSFSVIGDFLKAKAPIVIIQKLLVATENKIDLDSLSSKRTRPFLLFEQRPLHIAAVHSLEALKLLTEAGADINAQCPNERTINEAIHLSLGLNNKYKKRITKPPFIYDFEKGIYNLSDFDSVINWSDAPYDRNVALKAIIACPGVVIVPRHLRDMFYAGGTPDDLLLEAVKVAHKNGDPDYWMLKYDPLHMALDGNRFKLAVELLKLGFNPLMEPESLERAEKDPKNASNADFKRFITFFKLNEKLYKKHAAEMYRENDRNNPVIDAEERKKIQFS